MGEGQQCCEWLGGSMKSHFSSLGEEGSVSGLIEQGHQHSSSVSECGSV